MYFLIPLGLATLAGIIYLAVSSKSTFKVRIAALCALGLMILAVIICLFLIFGGKSASGSSAFPDAPPVEESSVSGPNIMAILLLVIILLALFLFVLIKSLREQKKKAKNTKPDTPVEKW